MPPLDTLAKQLALAEARKRFPDAAWETQGVPESAPILRCTVNGQTRWIPYLHEEEVQVCATLQEARRAINRYDARHLPRLQRGFGPRPREADLPSVFAAPARARFETADVPRLPVEVTPAADAFLASGNEQTRLLPLALAEAFGQVSSVTGIRLDLLTPPGWRGTALEVHVQPADPAGRWLLRTETLLLRHPSGHVAHTAPEAAAELVRSFRKRKG